MTLREFSDDYQKMMNIIDHFDFETFVNEHNKGMDLLEVSDKFKVNCLIYYASAIKRVDLSKFPPMNFIQYLIQNGIDIDYQDKEGLTAMHFSIGKTINHLELNKALLFLKANASIKSKYGTTPLWIAISEYRGEEVLLNIIYNLLNAGATLLETNKEGKTLRMLIESKKDVIPIGRDPKAWDLSFLLDEKS